MNFNIEVKKIGFIGNCQMMALSHYINILLKPCNTYWFCCNKEWERLPWPRNSKVFGENQTKHNIFGDDNIKKILPKCDTIIYQPEFNSLNLINNNCNLKHQKAISISPILVNNFDYMERKEKKYNTEISVTKLIKKYQDKKLYIKHDYHPTSFLFLEIVREICHILNIKFYDDAIYDELSNQQYPKY